MKASSWLNILTSHSNKYITEVSFTHKAIFYYIWRIFLILQKIKKILNPVTKLKSCTYRGRNSCTNIIQVDPLDGKLQCNSLIWYSDSWYRCSKIFHLKEDNFHPCPVLLRTAIHFGQCPLTLVYRTEHYFKGWEVRHKFKISSF